MQIEVKLDQRLLRRGLDDLAKKQLPFAIATALTATAGRAGLDWRDEMETKLDRPTPFTKGSVTVRPARKSDLTAVVYLKDIAASYLEPYLEGGDRKYGNKRGMIVPKNVTLNAYGNLTKSRLARLKAQKNVFVGAVRLKSGQVVNGVWQRPAVGKRRGGGRGNKGSNTHKVNRSAGLTERTTLKLLMRFADTSPAPVRLDFKGRTLAAVRRTFETEFAKALDHALSTAR